MAEFARINGFGNYAQGTIYSVSQQKAFIITAAAVLTTEDDAANEVMEAIIREVQPLMYFSADTSATVTVIVDGHAVDAATLQARLRNMSPVGPNAVDLSAITVAAAASLTAA
jgi:hypothetical protein